MSRHYSCQRLSSLLVAAWMLSGSAVATNPKMGGADEASYGLI